MLLSGVSPFPSLFLTRPAESKVASPSWLASKKREGENH